MTDHKELDRLLVTLDVDVQTLAFCELRRGRRLVAPPVDAIMMHYVLAGTMHMTVEGFEPMECGPGCIAIIPPSVPLYVVADEGPASDMLATEHCAISRDGVLFCDMADGGVGDLRYVSGMVLASFSGSFGLFDRLREPISQNLGSVAIVRHAYELMLEELGRPALGARALTSALMKACLVLVLREFLEASDSRGALLDSLMDPRLSRPVRDVLDRPRAPHTLDSLAASAGMSRSAFSRRFHQAFATSPMDFVARTRLHHSAQLLRSTPLPVKLIAATVGFGSRSHFSRAFKSAYGLDPTAYREQAGKAATDPPRSGTVPKPVAQSPRPKPTPPQPTLSN